MAFGAGTTCMPGHKIARRMALLTGINMPIRCRRYRCGGRRGRTWLLTLNAGAPATARIRVTQIPFAIIVCIQLLWIADIRAVVAHISFSVCVGIRLIHDAGTISGTTYYTASINGAVYPGFIRGG